MQRLLTRTTGPRLLGAAVCAAALGLAAACGSSPAPAATGAAPVTSADTAAQAAAGQAEGHSGHSSGNAGHAGRSGGSAELELYAVQTGTLGVVVTDGNGRVLYGSSGDQTNPPQSHCSDACAQSWLPLTVAAGQEPELLGVDATAVGRLARPDGSSQLTLGGWPVYVNRNDDGQLKAAVPGLQAGGWFAMSPTGEKVAVPG